MRSIISFCLLLSLTSICQAQTNTKEQDEVLAVINQLFDGMRSEDSTLVRDTFYSEIEMYTSYNDRNGKPVFKKDSPDDFVKAVGTPHEKVWDERIWGTEGRVDGNLAQVWTYYAFYLGDTFRHCGVDAFHLTKTANGWKIFHLTDTRQRDGCEVPEDVK